MSQHLAAGLKLHSDFGLMHGESIRPAHSRTCWANQHPGIVDDAVFELMIEPKF